MNFYGLLASQWKGLVLSWQPMLVHVSVYAALCLVLKVLFQGEAVEQYIDRLLMITAVASVMIQKGNLVARLLWLGVTIGEAGRLVSHSLQLLLPGLPTDAVQLLYAGLLLVLFLLLSRSGGNGGLPVLERPVTPTRSPAGVR